MPPPGPTMLRDVAVWLLYSPRRLLAVAVPALALALLGALSLPEDHTGPGGTHPGVAAPSTTPLSHPAEQRSEEHTERTASGRVLRRAALSFLGDYVVRPDAPAPRAMRKSMRQTVTPALWQGLRLARPGSLPRGRITEVTVETSGPFSGAVTAELSTGAVLMLSIVAWDQGWRVSDVRPAETP
jgi:hypothetical protein